MKSKATNPIAEYIEPIIIDEQLDYMYTILTNKQ